MFIPGRIEIVGKHTDYCGGRSIVCATDRGFRAEIEARTDARVVLEDVAKTETYSFSLSTQENRPEHWSNYAIEVGRRLTENFRHLKGVEIRFSSDLPMAAGLSSSSALMIMVFAALDAVNDLKSRGEYRRNISNDLNLAEFLSCIENGESYHELTGSAGVGTIGGSQDHAAIILGRAETLTCFSYRPLEREADMTFPVGHSIVVASSGLAAEKTGRARENYNRLSRSVSEITKGLGAGKTLRDLVVDLGIEELLRRVRTLDSSFTSRELTERVEQFRIENFEVVPSVLALFTEGRISDLREPLELSQELASRFLRNQTSETVFLQRSAVEIGSVASSAFGAGFGGSVYAIVARADADAFKAEWRRVYAAKFPEHLHASDFFVTRPSQCELM